MLVCLLFILHFVVGMIMHDCNMVEPLRTYSISMVEHSVTSANYCTGANYCKALI